jgi:uncharacterized protein (DUF1330 family)
VTAKGYWIARLDIKNAEGMPAYAEAASAAIKRHGGRYLARGGRAHHAEGQHRARNVVVVFPDFECAQACWYSPEYQAAIALRRPHADGDFLILEGCEE